MLDVFKTLTDGILEKAKTFKGDWNENDSSSPNYIKNRTHWAEITESVVLEETSVTITSDSGCLVLSSSITFVVGETYYVSFNGTQYECVSYKMWNAPVIGNGALAGGAGGNGEPFLFVGGYNLFYTSETGTCTTSIIATLEKVHKLDEKYLPDMSQYAKTDEVITWDEAYDTFLTSQTQSNWSTTNTSDPSYIKNKPQIYSDVVRYNSSQYLTNSQKAAARWNIGVTSADWNINDVNDFAYVKNRIAYYGTATLFQSSDTTVSLSMPTTLKSGSNNIYYRKYSRTNGMFDSVFSDAKMISVELGGEILYLKKDSLTYYIANTVATTLSCYGNKSLLSDEYEDSGESILILRCDTNDEVGGVYSSALYVAEDGKAIIPTVYKYQLDDMKQLDEMLIPDTIARVEDIPHTEVITGKIVYQGTGSVDANGSEYAYPYSLMKDGINLEYHIGELVVKGSAKTYAPLSNDKYAYFGNLALISDKLPDTGEDYLILFIDKNSGGYGCDIFANGARYSNHDVLIKYPDRTTIHELDEKYIPDTIARVDSVNALSSLVGDTSVATQINNATANYYTKTQIDTYELITVADIDEICGGVTEGSLAQSDVDELMAQLQ